MSAFRNNFILIFLLVQFLTPLAIAQDWPDYSKGILKAEDVLASAKAITKKVYPNADQVLVDDYILSQYETDGRAIEWDDTYVKVLSEKGKRENQNLSFYFTVPETQVAVTTLEIFKPNGQVVKVDIEKQSKVMIDSEQMASNIFDPNLKQLNVGVPGIEVGDILHYVSRHEIIKPKLPNSWSDYQIFEYTSPIKKHTFEVIAPKALPLRSIELKDAVKNTVKNTKREEGDRIIYRWDIADVPRMYEEPDMPRTDSVIQRLLVSTISSWQEISTWYWELSKPRIQAISPEMNSKVKELTKGLNTNEEKINAIFKWVSQEVRYLGLTMEKEAPGWEPHDASLTFKNRHGVCRDKTALLVSMLKLAGLKAYPVLMYIGPRIDKEVPQLNFNHAIACVKNEDKKCILMDPTDESTKDLLPAYLSNRSYLVAKPKGADLDTSPIVPSHKNMMLIDTEAELDEYGTLTAASTLNFNGINDSSYRGHLAQLTLAERRNFFERSLKQSVAGAKLLEFKLLPKDLLDTTKPLSLKLKFQAKDFPISNDQTALIPALELGHQVGMINFVISNTSLKKREYPLLTHYACGLKEQFKIKLPPAMGQLASLPSFQPINNPTHSWEKSISFENATLTGSNEIHVKAVEIQPIEYSVLKSDLKKYEHDAKKMVIFEGTKLTQAKHSKNTSALSKLKANKEIKADAEILEHNVRFKISNQSRWVETHYIKKKILSYKGKKDNAELKIHFNEGWEKVRLQSASVSNKGSKKRISADEQNIMDEEWVASAPRYPATKILVANLPGVEIGSIIEIEYEIIRQQRPFFSAIQVFRTSDPILEKSLSLEAPKSLNFSIVKNDRGLLAPQGFANKNEQPIITQKMTEEEDKTIYKWSAKNQTAIKQEQDLPPLSYYMPSIFMSSGDWRSYAKKAQNFLLKATENQTKAQAKALELTKDIKALEEKIIAIRDFVDKTIRAVGPDFNDLSLRNISNADQTLADAYGNSADRAVLIFTMLKALNLFPHFVLTTYTPQPKAIEGFWKKHASLHLFTDVLVQVQTARGPIYLNDTGQYAALGTTESDGVLALSLNTGEVKNITVPNNMKDLIEYDYKIALDFKGNASFKIETKMHGIDYANYHQNIAEKSPEELKRYHQELLAKVSESAIQSKALETKYDQYPAIQRFSAIVEEHAIIDGDYMYLNLPKSLQSFLPLQTEERQNPLYHNQHARVKLNIEIEVPKEYSELVLGPQAGQWPIPDFAGAYKVKINKERKNTNFFTLNFDLELKPFLMSTEDYPKLLQIYKLMSHPRSKMLMFRKVKKEE